MQRPVCYDVTRLLTRVLNATPNGIDRVDFALATHFLASSNGPHFGATATGFGARLIQGPAAAEAVAAIGAHWGETSKAPESDPAFRKVVAFVAGHRGLTLPATRRRPLVPHALSGVGGWTRRHGLPLAKTPRAHLPLHSVYVNASQFPLWVAASFEWLEARPDIRAAFVIHDLLPVRMPEYFRAAEFERHRKRLQNFARFGTAAIVTTRTVAGDLEAHLAALGRRNCPIFVAPTPIASVFATPRVIDPALSGRPFFVFCSTLEPRKNHLMILAVWRALVERLGGDAPLLIMIGTRGWHYGPIVDLIARAPALRDHVLEVSGLSTPALKRLIDNAQAVLMPSFGEGYGLPVHEALTAGAPVVASDIPAFREIEAGDLELLSPLDGEAWLETIASRSRAARASSSASLGPLPNWSEYFAALDGFLDAL